MSISESKLFLIEKQLLLGRLLTRSGDQAWDFVVPLALLYVFPGKIQISALYYLIAKVGTFLITPWIGKWIDSNQRRKVVKIGVWIQFFAILGGLLCFYLLSESVHSHLSSIGSREIRAFFIVLSVFGIMASVGTLITDITVGNDLVPTLIPSERLTHFNTWLRRIDLGTEVGAPIVAGALLAMKFTSIPLMGLFLVGLWNLISFIPEYLILLNIISRSDLHLKETNQIKDWKDFLQFNIKEAVLHPIFWLICSYSLLWLSALSPHGVLLTGYLKDKMSLPEIEIGAFRGLGALFGLISTITFPYFVKRMGLINSSMLHLFFQGLSLSIGVFAFALETQTGVYIFLFCILLSRVGLYGFSNGEFELRQRLIPEGKRGELNSLSYFTTTMATLVLFGAGSLLSNTEDFKYLVFFSVAAVIVANVVFFRWTKKRCQI